MVRIDFSQLNADRSVTERMASRERRDSNHHRVLLTLAAFHQHHDRFMQAWDDTVERVVPDGDINDEMRRMARLVKTDKALLEPLAGALLARDRTLLRATEGAWDDFADTWYDTIRFGFGTLSQTIDLDRFATDSRYGLHVIHSNAMVWVRKQWDVTVQAKLRVLLGWALGMHLHVQTPSFGTDDGERV